MVKQRFEKLFSVEEANQLIPRLENLIAQIQTRANQLREHVEQLAEKRGEEQPEYNDFDEVVKQHPELREIGEDIGVLVGEIHSYGCILKDIDLGLVDFPHEMEHETVFLCWQFGEPTIAAWHTIDTGFGARRPLAGAPKRFLN